MMKHLKFLLPILAVALVGFSCEKENESAEDDQVIEIVTAADLVATDVANLPEAAQEYIEFNYFDTYVETVEVAESRGFRVVMADGEVVFFNTRGDVLEYTGIVRPNGPLGGEHPHGPCVRLRRLLRGHGGQHDCNGDGRPDGPFAYAIEELPTTITDYVTANYPDNEVVRAAFKDGRFVILVDVPVVLAFDEAGAFLAEINPLEHCSRPCAGMTAADLPAVITDYITATFPEGTIRLVCGNERYTRVMLTQNGRRIILGFDADGNLVYTRRP
jgi:hypothetical protein